jgi:hypothetical protein
MTVPSTRDQELRDRATERIGAFAKKVADFEEGEWAAFLEAVGPVGVLDGRK